MAGFTHRKRSPRVNDYHMNRKEEENGRMGILGNGTLRSMAAATLLVTGSAGLYSEGDAVGPLKLGLLC